MLCYQDKTFCNAFPTRCSNNKCHRAYTDEIEHAAQHWWLSLVNQEDSYPPIAMSDFYDNCNIKIPVDKT